MRPRVTRQAWAKYIRKNWDELRLRAIEEFVFNMQCELNVKDVTDRVLAGKKFGPLDINTINTADEFSQECADCIAYLAASDLQDG